MREVRAEHRFPGGVVQDVIYRWRADTDLLDRDQGVTLKYARQPRPVDVLAWSGSGAELNVGRLALMPSDMPAPARALRDESDLEATIVRLDCDWLDEIMQLEAGVTSADVEADLDLRDITITNTLMRLSQELTRPGPSTGRMIELLTGVLAIELARYVAARVRGRQEQIGQTMLSAERLEAIRRFITGYPRGAPIPREVAQQCGISAPHLRRLFKRSTGQTLQSYIDEVRLEKACVLLGQTDTPLKVVPHLIGFSGYSSFATAFRRAMGETPCAYRTRMTMKAPALPH